MCKRVVLALLQAVSPLLACAGPNLTDVETRWLEAGWPVLRYAQAQSLPLDVVVQPHARPGDVPLAMAFIEGRCKLVLSMRGRPAGDDPEALLRDVQPELHAVVIAAMTAHELAHCWRHVQGAWRTLPTGFTEAAEPAAQTGADLHRLRREMSDVRREEGFADLVGLTWTASRHPEHYAAVHAWFTRIRDKQPVDGAHHDTRVWIRKAARAEALAGGATPFEAAWRLWLEGLESQR